ncbi:MAG: DUF3267 domain-containing protein [Flavobacteriales bacterium]
MSIIILLDLVVSYLYLIFIHELIHAFFFYIFCKKGIGSVKIGIKKELLTPYVHRKEALTKNQYTIALLMPLIILGIIPLILSFILPDL